MAPARRARSASKVKALGISPFLWFDHEAESAARLYVSLFRNSEINGIVRYGKGDRRKAGSVMIVNFKLNGQQFTALNGGPVFKFTPAISFVINCTTQAEVDFLWKRLGSGGTPGQCGWIEDRFGVSWQVVPRRLLELLTSPDPGTSARVYAAMLKMGKIVIRDLERAARPG